MTDFEKRLDASQKNAVERELAYLICMSTDRLTEKEKRVFKLALTGAFLAGAAFIQNDGDK